MNVTFQPDASISWLIQLLGIAWRKKVRSSGIDYGGTSGHSCEALREDVDMVWDGLCFAFLLIQKRLFKSYYFFHIVDETKAMSILASRGAELLENLHRKRIEYQENEEKAVLQKLKFKMDKIKADQQRIQGPSYREPATHKVGKQSYFIITAAIVFYNNCISSLGAVSIQYSVCAHDTRSARLLNSLPVKVHSYSRQLSHAIIHNYPGFYNCFLKNLNERPFPCSIDNHHQQGRSLIRSYALIQEP